MTTNKIIILLSVLIGLIFPTAAAEPTPTGKAIISAYEFQHTSAIFAENRRYMVSLPERYLMTQRQYPSLFVIDADFQFQHVAAVVKNLSRIGKTRHLVPFLP